MKRVIEFCVLLVSIQLGAAEPPVRQEDYAQGHVLVKLASLPSVLSGLTLADAQRHLEADLGFPEGTKLVENGFMRWDRQTHFKTATLQSDWLLRQWHYLTLPKGMSPETCLRQLEGNPWIEYAEVDPIGTGGSTFPTDPDFGQQWHLYNPASTNRIRADIHAPEAWDTTMGSTNILVAVLDTGLDMTLSEFSNRWVAGYNFAYTNGNPTDDHGHGTAVAGVLGANANNGEFGAGLDWYCKIMPIKVLNAANSGFYSWWASGVDWASANGCKVINLSSGGTNHNTTLSNAIEQAINSGIVFVTITHNLGTNITFPGRMSNVITVGATGMNDQRAVFSNYGPAIDLVAPGSNMVTVGEGGGLEAWWGTSFSGPLVAAAAALLLSRDPTLSHYQVRDLLCSGADDQVGDASDTPGFDNYYGWGRLNIQSSLTLLETRPVAQLGTNNELVISWYGPTNTPWRKHHRLEKAGTPEDGWMPATTNFAYNNRQCFVSTNMIDAAAFYRVAVPTP